MSESTGFSSCGEEGVEEGVICSVSFDIGVVVVVCEDKDEFLIVID